MSQASSFRFLWLGLACFTLSALGAVKVEQLDHRTLYHFDVERVLLDRVEDRGSSFVKINLQGIQGYEGTVNEVGKPRLPAVRFFVDGDGDIRVSPGHPDAPWGGRGYLRVEPGRLSDVKRPGAYTPLVRDEETYRSTEFYPRDVYEVEKVGSIRGRQRRLVSLYPIRYVAAENRFETIRHFDVSFRPEGPALVEQGDPTLAVVVGARFKNSPALDQYVSFKKSQGLQVVRIDYDTHKMDPKALRLSLKGTYSEPGRSLEGVVIVGDAADVPGYSTPLLDGTTDHYYRCLDTDDYASDIGTPDVALGRFAVETEKELEIVVKKQIRYDSDAFQDRTWMSKMSFIASDDSSHWQIAEGSYDYMLAKFTIPKGIIGNFPGSAQPGGDLLYAITHKATSADVVSRMREGRGFINYGGHGSETSWAGPHVGKADVLSMSHPEANPFVMANACVTGHFLVDSFAETWLRHPSGAIAYYGSMDSTYWDEDDILQRKLYDVMFGDGELHISRFTDAGLAEVWRHYGGKGRSKYYWETYHVFGEAGTQVRLGGSR